MKVCYNINRLLNKVLSENLDVAEAYVESIGIDSNIWKTAFDDMDLCFNSLYTLLREMGAFDKVWWAFSEDSLCRVIDPSKMRKIDPEKGG